MKRHAGPDDSPPSKLPKGNTEGKTVNLRFLIPARVAGIMIGKGGENIKKIRSQHNVKLNIPDNRGPERVMTIEGELQSICNIMLEVSPKLKDIMNAKLSDPRRIMSGMNYRSRKNPEQGDEPEKDEESDDYMLDYRILVHESQAGSVIGRGGERIKELRKKYRMRVIKVYQMLAPLSSDRVVQLVADPENAIHCLKSVVEAVESAPPRGHREDYDAVNFSEMEALNYGGWLTREAMENMSQGGYPRGLGAMPPAYMGGGVPYGMGGPEMMQSMGGGPGPRGPPRPPMGGGGGSGYRGGGYSAPRGVPAPVPPPGPRPMGTAGGGSGGYGGMPAGMYDSSTVPPSYEDPNYNGAMYGARGAVDQGAYAAQSYGGQPAGPAVAPTGYGASAYQTARPPVENAATAGMPRGGGGGAGYGGYAGSAQAPGDQKASQWYGGWS